MSTKKAISTSFVAIFILIITQIIAQSIASIAYCEAKRPDLRSKTVAFRF